MPFGQSDLTSEAAINVSGDRSKVVSEKRHEADKNAREFEAPADQMFELSVWLTMWHSVITETEKLGTAELSCLL